MSGKRPTFYYINGSRLIGRLTHMFYGLRFAQQVGGKFVTVWRPPTSGSARYDDPPSYLLQNIFDLARCRQQFGEGFDVTSDEKGIDAALPDLGGPAFEHMRPNKFDRDYFANRNVVTRAVRFPSFQFSDEQKSRSELNADMAGLFKSVPLAADVQRALDQATSRIGGERFVAIHVRRSDVCDWLQTSLLNFTQGTMTADQLGFSVANFVARAAPPEAYFPDIEEAIGAGQKIVFTSDTPNALVPFEQHFGAEHFVDLATLIKVPFPIQKAFCDFKVLTMADKIVSTGSIFAYTASLLGNSRMFNVAGDSSVEAVERFAVELLVPELAERPEIRQALSSEISKAYAALNSATRKRRAKSEAEQLWRAEREANKVAATQALADRKAAAARDRLAQRAERKALEARQRFEAEQQWHAERAMRKEAANQERLAAGRLRLAERAERKAARVQQRRAAEQQWLADRAEQKAAAEQQRRAEREQKVAAERQRRAEQESRKAEAVRLHMAERAEKAANEERRRAAERQLLAERSDEKAAVQQKHRVEHEQKVAAERQRRAEHEERKAEAVRQRMAERAGKAAQEEQRRASEQKLLAERAKEKAAAELKRRAEREQKVVADRQRRADQKAAAEQQRRAEHAELKAAAARQRAEKKAETERQRRAAEQQWLAERAERKATAERQRSTGRVEQQTAAEQRLVEQAELKAAAARQHLAAHAEKKAAKVREKAAAEEQRRAELAERKEAARQQRLEAEQQWLAERAVRKEAASRQRQAEAEQRRAEHAAQQEASAERRRVALAERKEAADKWLAERKAKAAQELRAQRAARAAKHYLLTAHGAEASEPTDHMTEEGPADALTGLRGLPLHDRQAGTMRPSRRSSSEQGISEQNRYLAGVERLFSTRRDEIYCTLVSARGEQALTWGGLEASARRFISAYREAGLRQGDVVLIFLKHVPELYGSFFGAMLGGFVPSFMPCASPRQDPAIYWSSHRQLLARVRPAAIVASADTHAEMRAAGLDIGDARSISIEELPEALGDFRASAEDATGLLQHSSGTTGLKKGVALSYAAIFDQIDSYRRALRLSSDDVIVSWLPLYHDMGLIACAILPTAFGVPIVHLDPFYWIGEPASLFERLVRHRGTLTWMPNFGFEHLATVAGGRAGEWDLRGVRAFINCSEPCKAQSFDRFAASFAAAGVRAGQLQCCYAMAETVFAVSQTAIGTEPLRIDVDPRSLEPGSMARAPESPGGGISLVETGTPIDGARVSVHDATRRPLPEGVVGEIAIAGHFLFSGYYKDPDRTAERLSGDRYFTGDIGFVRDGRVFVLGRSDDMIIVNGRNLFAHEIEAAVAGVEGAKAGRTVAAPLYDERTGSNSLIVITEHEKTSRRPQLDVQRDVIKTVFSTFAVQPRKVRIVGEGWLIKTTSGKISRKDNLAKFLAEGGLGG